MNRAVFLLMLLAGPAVADAPVMEARGTTGAAVLLYAEQGACLAPARKAEFVGKDGTVVPGCFKLVGGDTVQLVFFDGDAMQVPVDAFRGKPGA